MVSNKLYQENTLIIGCSVLVALCASCFTILDYNIKKERKKC